MRVTAAGLWWICTMGLVVYGQAAPPAAASTADDDVVMFKSDVSLVRVDAQVLGRDNRAVNGLQITDFTIRDGGSVREIRNFAQENMPLDVLFLLDVSGSMRPHVQRVAMAAEGALSVLNREDRVAIMVFDRSTRVHMQFQSGRAAARRGFDDVLAREDFNGGTDITRGLLDAAQFVKRNARPDARRAIVILTDDRTERDRDEYRVGRALAGADAVLSALIAPDALRQRGPVSTGGGWPFPGGGGGGMGWPFPGGGGRRGGGYPGGGPVMVGNRTHSAGTAEIARDSGGDSSPVDDAEALESTMARIRQRYAIYFLVPPGVRAGEERQIEVALSSAALRRYPGAEVRYRRTYTATSSTEGNAAEAPPVEISQAPASDVRGAEAPVSNKPRRRPGVIDESRSTSRGPAADTNEAGWKKADTAPEAAPAKPAPAEPAPATTGGWRRVKPGEQQ